ncbi:pupal cuticle protein Edg-78E-like [Episyrphus balteatus]|uniref:pupal cuticle protein Edg-78E-like n=1 Tax=Episyrphus balteatus TaxID=286459 RepID=UPI0024860D87|nr:pupal cuticle protein Edg-78E-like [Episyrphus balteatus]
MYNRNITFVTLLSVSCAAPPAPSPSAAAAAPSSDATAEVKNYTDQIHPDGSFGYQFETSNGINIQESGTANGTVQGAVQYQSPDGEQIQLTYTADENGYQPSGSHLPTSPPVPEQIQKALEYIQAHPPPEEPKSA